MANKTEVSLKGLEWFTESKVALKSGSTKIEDL